MKPSCKLSAIAVACSSLFLSLSVNAGDYSAANGASVIIDVTNADYMDKVIAGQSAKGDTSKEGSYNWNKDKLIVGAEKATGLLQNLQTSVVIKGKHTVQEEVIGGSYIHTNHNNTKKALKVNVKSTNVVIDGAGVHEGIVGGNKTNGWETETVNFQTDSTSIYITNGAKVENMVMAGDMLKFASDGKDDYCAIISGLVDSASVVIDNASEVGGVVGGTFVEHHDTPIKPVKAFGDVKSSQITIDKSIVHPIGFESDNPYNFDAPYAIVAGGLLQTTRDYDMASSVDQSKINIQNGSKIEGDVLLGGLLMIDKKPSEVGSFDAKLNLGQVSLSISDSTVNGSIIAGNVAHYDTAEELPGIVAPEGLKGSVERVDIVLNNAVVRDDIVGLGSEKSTLTLSGVNTIGNIEKFSHVSLVATEANNLSLQGQPILTFTGDEVNLSGITFNLFGELDAGGDVAILSVENLDALVGDGKTTIVGHGTFIDQTWVGSVEELKTELTNGQLNTGSIEFAAKANENTKTLSEVRLGSVAMINQGAEFIADDGLSALNNVATKDHLATFATVTVGSSKYKTGSSVDLDSWNMVLGTASKVDNVVLAGFLELGTGSSDTKVANAKADGDHEYYGLGIATRWGNSYGFEVDSALRLGMSNTEFSGVYALNGTEAKYDSDAFYTSMHIGTACVLPLSQSTDLKMYGRYVVTYLDGDHLRLDGTNDKYKADSVMTHAFRLGLRMAGSVNTFSNWRVGAAFEHTFNGNADASINTIDMDTPTLKGNTGMFEAGMNMKPSEKSPWSLDFGFKGYVGNREGIVGSVSLLYQF